MLLEGKQIGRYRFLNLLGSGGMGDVFLAEDPHIEQQVAIKIIRSDTIANANIEMEKGMARLFQREAKAIAKLDHPNILPLFDYGEEQIDNVKLVYLVMPYRPEGTLADRLRQRAEKASLMPDEVEHIIRQAADALQHAHDRQIIHQDVKPSNFLIRNREESPTRPDLLLADFGIAKMITATSSMSQSIRGTPAYMAPEQWVGVPVPASDQYALAIMAYELLTGRLPFRGGPGQMMYQHINVQPVPPSLLNPDLSKDIDTVLLHSLEKEPEKRFASMKAFAIAFQQTIYSLQVSHTSVPIAMPDIPVHHAADKALPAVSESDPHILPSPTESTIQTDNTIQQTDPSQQSIVGKSESAKVMDDVAQMGTGSMLDENEDIIPPNETKIALQTSERETTVSPPKSRRRRRLVVMVSSLLVLLLIGGGIVYTMPSILASHANIGSGRIGHTTSLASSALVSVITTTTDFRHTYAISAVTGTPDASKNQVAGARILTTTTAAYSKTVSTTGQRTIPGTNASGTVAIDNFNTSAPITLTAGSVYANTYSSNNIHMVLDATVTVPPAPSSSTWSQEYAPGHILEIGTIGNNEFNNNISGSLSWSVFNNPPFSNGRDPQTYTAVQQSDIDGATNGLINTSKPDPQQQLQPQLQANEKFVSNPQCNPNVIANHVAGDKASSVTVTVNFTCTGTVYDPSKALSMATILLTNQATTALGAGYTLAKHITTKLENAVLADAANGTITLTIDAEGTWMFQFNNAQKQALAKLVAGKSKSDAFALLLKQQGITKVDIQLSAGEANMLPLDVSQIKIVIRGIPL
jgi:VCBS repeat-containing protein